MNILNSMPKAVRRAVLAMVCCGSVMGYAHSTVKVVNNSTQPWRLEIKKLAAPILAQGMKDASPLELSNENSILAYVIQPGETCTLQFKGPVVKPVIQEVGLVDKAGGQKGQFNLEATPVQGQQTLMAGAGDDCSARISLASDAEAAATAKDVLKLDTEGVLTINADFWP